MSPNVEPFKYRWRQLTDNERTELLEWRKSRGHPWHSPPHRAGGTRIYHLSASCYEHACYVGASLVRMQTFCEQLVATLVGHASVVYAWCVLPNHYHALVHTSDVIATIGGLGRLHGQTSFTWNTEEGTRGRKVWFRCLERNIRGERHRMATMNYVHHNAVHHGYVKTWKDWPFSSAHDFLEKMGHGKAQHIWKMYPILNFGKGWDDAQI